MLHDCCGRLKFALLTRCRCPTETDETSSDPEGSCFWYYANLASLSLMDLAMADEYGFMKHARKADVLRPVTERIQHHWEIFEIVF
jgi:hypothetical protein